AKLLLISKDDVYPGHNSTRDPPGLFRRGPGTRPVIHIKDRAQSRGPRRLQSLNRRFARRRRRETRSVGDKHPGSFYDVSFTGPELHLQVRRITAIEHLGKPVRRRHLTEAKGCVASLQYPYTRSIDPFSVQKIEQIVGE